MLKQHTSVENNPSKPFIGFILSELDLVFYMFQQQDSFNGDISRRLGRLENRVKELEKKND